MTVFRLGIKLLLVVILAFVSVGGQNRAAWKNYAEVTSFPVRGELAHYEICNDHECIGPNE